MAGTDRLARFLLAIPLALIAVVTVVVFVVSATGEPQIEAPSNLTANLVCQDTQSCYVEVTIEAVTEAVSGVVVAEIEGGVRFQNKAGDLVVTNNSHRAATAGNIIVPVGESRTLVFPLSPDKSTLYSGAYVMSFQLSGPTGAESRYPQVLPVHVWVQPDGNVHILNNSALLDGAYGEFRSRSERLAYFVQIDPARRTQGTVYVRVNGVDKAIVSLSVTDGVLFTATGGTAARQAAGLIRPEGYRILAFPFQYAPGSYTGPRHITAGLDIGANTTLSEELPFQLQVNDGRPAGQPSIQVLPGN